MALLNIELASFIICRPLPIVGHQLSAKFTKVTRYNNEFTEYRNLTRNCSCSFVLRYSALVFSLASPLDMPARTKKAEAATNIWRKRKEKVSPSNRPKKLKAWSNESMLLAITAVRDGTMSSNMASRTYNVPPSKKGKKPGPSRVLTSQQSLEMLVQKGRKKQRKKLKRRGKQGNVRRNES